MVDTFKIIEVSINLIIDFNDSTYIVYFRWKNNFFKQVLFFSLMSDVLCITLEDLFSKCHPQSLNFDGCLKDAFNSLTPLFKYGRDLVLTNI